MISGFSFIHNALTGGYPLKEAILQVRPFVDEIVIVDMESDDGTRELLKSLGVKIIEGKWGDKAGETLKAAHDLYKECSYDTILHFEADEVFDTSLLKIVSNLVLMGQQDIAVYRLQLEQNFQRCRWYPELVHRIFPKNSDTTKNGHTTDRHKEALYLAPENGFLWDCTNCFKDNWISRVKQQAELWNNEPNLKRVPIHFTHSVDLTLNELEAYLAEEHWAWKTTPFNIPKILRPLVGKKRYNPL